MYPLWSIKILWKLFSKAIKTKDKPCFFNVQVVLLSLPDDSLISYARSGQRANKIPSPMDRINLKRTEFFVGTESGWRLELE